jgi:ribosomal protein S12 methylthiotransferase
MKNKKFYIHSLGCAKNQVDSEIMIASLCHEGYICTGIPENADIIIINTCGFIEPAKEESINTSLEFRARFPDKKIIIAGCLSERYDEELRKALPEIDGFIGNKSAETAGEKVKTILTGSVPAGTPRHGEKITRTRFLSFPGSAYVKIAEGCQNKCTYCTIPLIRGELISRSVDAIAEEVSDLLSQGVVEINLVAQDTGSYGMDKAGRDTIFTLCKTLSGLAGKFWVRLLYIHPDRFPYKILDLCREDSRFLPYFDLPFQHASPGILKLMGRNGDPDSYLSLIHTIRTTLPDAVIRSTFLTGFPGETEEDFRILTNFQERAGIDWLGVFSYSREEGTPAYSFSGQVKKSIARERKKIIEQNQIRITEHRLSQFTGRELDVFIEEPVKNEDLSLGRGYLHAPDVDGLVVIHGTGYTPGTFVRARIIRQNNFDLEAVVL